jgi:hypothetical protein
MRRSRVPSIVPGTFFVAQSWADRITNMAGFTTGTRICGRRVRPVLALADEPLDSPLTISAELHRAVMALAPKDRRKRAKVNKAAARVNTERWFRANTS